MLPRRSNPLIRTSVVLMLAYCFGAAGAQDIVVPVEIQIPLFSKILAFDRNFEKRSGGEWVVGILFQSRFRRSLTVKNELLDFIRKNPALSAKQIAIHYTAIDLSEIFDLRSAIDAMHINALYVAPLRAVDLKTITRISRARQLTTWTGVPEYVEEGISIGIGLSGENPLILINRSASRLEGSDFSSQLLKMAQVIPETAD